MRPPSVADQSLRHCSFQDKFLEDTYSGSLIPGPAGVIQYALRRKKNKDPVSFNTQGEPIPTQEFLRIEAKNADGEEKDFYEDPWVAAVDYIRTAGLARLGENGKGTPLTDIKSRDSGWSKIDQVMAIVKSFTLNGLGDFMVTLKDPSETIDASIHREVLLHSEFGRKIQVGAVVILTQVTVCRLPRSTTYLNITSKNISKVITKDSNPVLEQWTEEQLEELFQWN